MHIFREMFVENIFCEKYVSKNMFFRNILFKKYFWKTHFYIFSVFSHPNSFWLQNRSTRNLFGQFFIGVPNVASTIVDAKFVFEMLFSGGLGGGDPPVSIFTKLNFMFHCLRIYFHMFTMISGYFIMISG